MEADLHSVLGTVFGDTRRISGTTTRRTDKVLSMAGRAALHRSRHRSAQYLWRLSPEDKELLHQRAADEGLTVQAYLERHALGRPDPVIRGSGPAVRHQQELPLTG